MEPGLVAGLPPEPASVAPSTAKSSATTIKSSGTTTAPTTDSSDGSDSSTGAEQPHVEEEPTAALFMKYLQPLLTTGPTIAEVRRKLGHEKGKRWTALFNEMLDFMVEQRNQHVSPALIHGNARQRFGIALGSMVTAVVKLPRSADGSVHVSAETDILSSNPRGGSKRTTKSADKDTKNALPGGPMSARQVVDQALSEVDPYWKADGPWTVDDALTHIELSTC